MGGEIIGTAMAKKKKKKGRPSLLDLQKRSLKLQKQQQQQQLQQQHQKNPNFIQNPKHSLSPPNAFPPPNRRSALHSPNPDGGRDDEDDDDERKEKKHKLLLGLNSHNDSNDYLHNYPNSLGVCLYGSDSNADGGDDPQARIKRRKISTVCLGSDEMGEKDLKATDSLHGSPVEPGPTTPLPDKKLLVFILDRLQKKDTYGVFSEPVDPEELPDYHDIIKNPMDFATVRKKLDEGAYANLEQFEKDVYLICSNAMQYNSPDTIYFRQARSIQELAKKDFDNLRQDSDSEPHPQPQPPPQPLPKVARRGRPPGKMKKSLDRSPFDRVGSEFASDATLATGSDSANLSNGYNLRRTTSYKHQSADILLRASYGSHSNETYATWLSEWENEFPASVVKAVLRYGKKPFTIDENKRDTYKNPVDSIQEPSVLTTFEGKLKQLMVVGLNSEHGYARSVARFAADLGPVAWKIASKKIKSVLPMGIDFGPGWVGENDLIEGQRVSFPDKQKVSNVNPSHNHFGGLQHATTMGTSSTLMSRDSAWSGHDFTKDIRGLSSQTESISMSSNIGAIKIVPSVPMQQKSNLHHDPNGFSRGVGYNGFQMETTTIGTPTGNSSLEHAALAPQKFGMVPTCNSAVSSLPSNDIDTNKPMPEISSGLLYFGNLSALTPGDNAHTPLSAGLGKSSWQGLSSYHQSDFPPFAPDLNVGFLTPRSPSSSVPIGSPQQPDLALQL